MGATAAMIVPTLFSTALQLAGGGSQKKSDAGARAAQQEQERAADDRRRRREERKEARELARLDQERARRSNPLSMNEQGVTDEANVARAGLKTKLGE